MPNKYKPFRDKFYMVNNYNIPYSNILSCTKAPDQQHKSIIGERPPRDAMRILITGGNGFIGSHVTKALEGHDVRIYDRAENPKDDIRDAARLRDAARDCDAIIHLAALVSVQETLAKPEETSAINALGSKHVLDAARETGARVILASTAAIYGLAPKVPTAEDTPLAPASPYGKSKAAMEAYGEHARKEGVPVVTLRLFNVYGEGQRADSPYAAVIPLFIERARQGEPLIIYGDGEQTRDFIHASDVGRAFASALSWEPGTYNVASGTATSINELARRILEVTRSESIVEHRPAREGDPVASQADISRARKQGFAPRIPLPEGLNRLAGGA